MIKFLGFCCRLQAALRSFGTLLFHIGKEVVDLALSLADSHSNNFAFFDFNFLVSLLYIDFLSSLEDFSAHVGVRFCHLFVCVIS